MCKSRVRWEIYCVSNILYDLAQNIVNIDFVILERLKYYKYQRKKCIQSLFSGFQISFLTGYLEELFKLLGEL